MFSDSSRPANRSRRMNADGSTNVFCQTCGEFIGKTMVPIVKAQCEICRRVELGEELSPEVIKTIQLGKQYRETVTMLTVPVDGSVQKRKFRVSDMTGAFLEAVGIKKKPKPEPDSVRASKEVKKGRLFEGTALGNMMDIDSKMGQEKKKK